MNFINCITCGEKVRTFKSNPRKYCSKDCYGKQNLGENNISKRLDIRKKISISKMGEKNNMFGKIGELNPNWKGKYAGYGAKHSWIYRILGKPGTCEECGLNKLTGRKINWANKSGKYLRDVSDWKRLCLKCHRKFDRHSLKINRNRKTGKFLKKNIKMESVVIR